MTSDEVLLTADEVAELVRVKPATVRGWARTGALAVVVLPGGQMRFRPADVRKLRGERVA